MLNYVKGKLEVQEETFIVIDVGGLGYRIFVSAKSSFYLKKVGEDVKVFTSMVVREDDITLYGFDNEEALYVFSKLTTVSGVGAKAAMSIFSALNTDEIKNAIVQEDADMLTKANGIGKKTAQRIVLDLKDKFKNILDNPINLVSTDKERHLVKTVDTRSEVVDALIELGYSRAEALDAVIKIPKELTTIEECIKYALKSF